MTSGEQRRRYLPRRAAGPLAIALISMVSQAAGAGEASVSGDGGAPKVANDRSAAPSKGNAAKPSAPKTKVPRTLDDYRYFRSLTIDLKGRMPTRDELDAFERADFDVHPWIEEQLRGPGYVERLTRVYMDALRLDVNPLLHVAPYPAMLYAVNVKDESGKIIRVFYRRQQRRLRDLTDGDFCMTPAESGFDSLKGTLANDALPAVVKREVLDKYTVAIRPWWLYRDYRSTKPSERIGHEWQASRYFQPTPLLLMEPDGKTEVTEIRVCREEAQTPERGTLWVSDRAKGPATPLPAGRTSRYPYEDEYARKHKGESIACPTQAGLLASVDCGCGIGLERCLPYPNDYTLTHYLPNRELVGLEGAFAFNQQQLSHYFRWWWREEAIHLFGYVFAEDRDVRELVTGRYTYVNGALAQFYKAVEPSSCCGHERLLPTGMEVESDPLFRPERVPALLPHEVDTWAFVPDRGPHAAGILTTPAFLQKFASRRARAAAAYTGLLCKNFVADASSAPPSSDPNLMARPGCATCHTTLEPLAAYFTRVKEGTSTFLSLPNATAACKLEKGKIVGYCGDFYDPAFSSDEFGVLRGAYASPEHAEGGPEALGASLAASPDYLSCAVEQVASSLLGRSLTSDDEELRARAFSRFTESGNRMRALVREILLDPAYAEARLGPEMTAAAPAPFVHPTLEGLEGRDAASEEGAR